MKSKRVKIKTTKQLCKIVDKWQKLLRLQDWRLAATLCRFKDIPNEAYDTLAGIAPNFEHKTAMLYVLHPDDVKDNMFTGMDVEKTVVHELMHLWTRALLESPRQEPGQRSQVNEEEQLNEALSNVLVDLFYKKKS